MDETTFSKDPVLEDAFAAYMQAQENGQVDAARQILRDHPGLAEEVATYYALCARVPRPWDSSVNSYDGQTIGDFELLHELGRGGEGVVYKAKQKSLQRAVAVKVIRHERFSQHREVERFRRDSTLLASLQHPNIVQIYYAGEAETGPYFAMELMADGSLKKKLADGWLPTSKQAAELTRVLALAMQCAHDKGIVHRDLKPANILLSSRSDAGEGAAVRGIGTPKIVDFGLAKKLDAGDSITQPGGIVGTPSYMAPEQAKGERADFASDIYGLGAILYELLTGRPPFVGASLVETLEQVRKYDPLPIRQLSPTVPPDLEVICLKCLEKDPSKRYASAGELAADLQRFLKGEAILARLPGITERAVRVLMRQEFTNVSVWGWIILRVAIINGIFHIIRAWLIASDQPATIDLGIVVLHLLLIAVVYWRGLRGCRLEAGDRQTIAYVIATIAGNLFLVFFYRPHEGMDLMAYRLSLYPLTALIQGVLVFVLGAIFWGGFYVYGVSHILLGFVMQLLPGWEPVLWGVFSAATLIPLGMYLTRLGQSPDFRK